MRVSTPTAANQWHRRTHLRNGAVVALCAALTGCGQSDTLPVLQVYQVKGTVLLANGKPLSGGWISFVPKANLAVTPSGEIGPDGTFSLATGGSGDGAPPGEYKVRVEAPQLGKESRNAKGKPAFPAKYTDEDSSGLVITVRAESNQLTPIVLK